jgi:hypothetical protein
MTPEQARQIIALANKRWVCEVVSSGTHNGAGCTAKVPHGGWWVCGERYTLSVPAEVVERAANT